METYKTYIIQYKLTSWSGLRTTKVLAPSPWDARLHMKDAYGNKTEIIVCVEEERDNDA